MYKDNNINKFLVLSSETIRTALRKISENKNRIIFVVSEYGELLGSFSDGDFRRWINDKNDINLDSPVEDAINTHVVFANQKIVDSEIYKLFSKDIDLIPIVDNVNRIISIVHKNKNIISIGLHQISDDSPCFIIAEIGNNHNGDFKLAQRLVDQAIESGADCVKFQARDLKTLYKSAGRKDISDDLGSQYTIDLLSKFQLSNKELLNIFDYCKSKNITPLCTPWDHQSLTLLENYGMEAYKVASADLTNLPLIESMTQTGKPLICSTGMSKENEIKITVDFLKQKNSNFVLLHCNSTYPAPIKDVNLNYITRLKNLYNVPVGYSGHEEGYVVPIGAVAFGACVIEKHFTLDKNLEGNDHKVSLLPSEFKIMVQSIRQIELAKGFDTKREISQGEMINRENLSKSLIAKRDLNHGDIITRDMLDIKSPGQGLQPIYMDELIGKKAKRNFSKGDYFFESDLTDEIIQPGIYKFSRPFGIPVRFHDYKKLSCLSNIDLVEFHLSYSDMHLDLTSFFNENEELEYVVHAPELFENDHLLDLASKNKNYRKKSVEHLNNVCDLTRKLNNYFKKTTNPKIVCNVGGFNTKGFINNNEKNKLYNLVVESLRDVNQNGVELIIQTMPPFPWHFGGKSHHNLFVDPIEIKDFCSKSNYRICFDISHSMMACNFMNIKIEHFIDIVSPYVAHMHISDAKGVDGEGITIGDGDVDFPAISQLVNQYLPKTSFIPEIWQGHKNSGEGFWNALNYLENYFGS